MVPLDVDVLIVCTDILNGESLEYNSSYPAQVSSISKLLRRIAHRQVENGMVPPKVLTDMGKTLANVFVGNCQK